VRYLYKLWFKLSGWKFNGAFPTDIKSYVVIVGPHTANIDFIVGIMARGILRINHVKYLGKSQLFKPPYGFIFRWLGGTPVERGKYNNLVEAVAAKFKDNKDFAIGLAPEGTRKKVDRIKTGFYHIAKMAGVPIIMVGLDFETKTIKIKDSFYPTNNTLSDFKQIIGFFASCKGIKPERGITNEVYKNMKEKLLQL
jgi:1-acyl-sn-glycerol-3-phosphate acyltransferase